MIVHATVRGGRFVIDEPAELPEGTMVELVVMDDSLDAMEVEERSALLAAIDEGIAEYRSGVPGIPAAQALAELKAAR